MKVYAPSGVKLRMLLTQGRLKLLCVVKFAPHLNILPTNTNLIRWEFSLNFWELLMLIHIHIFFTFISAWSYEIYNLSPLSQIAVRSGQGKLYCYSIQDTNTLHNKIFNKNVNYQSNNLTQKPSLFRKTTADTEFHELKKKVRT